MSTPKKGWRGVRPWSTSLLLATPPSIAFFDPCTAFRTIFVTPQASSFNSPLTSYLQCMWLASCLQVRGRRGAGGGRRGAGGRSHWGVSKAFPSRCGHDGPGSTCRAAPAPPHTPPAATPRLPPAAAPPLHQNRVRLPPPAEMMKDLQRQMR